MIHILNRRVFVFCKSPFMNPVFKSIFADGL